MTTESLVFLSTQRTKSPGTAGDRQILMKQLMHRGVLPSYTIKLAETSFIKIFLLNHLAVPGWYVVVGTLERVVSIHVFLQGTPFQITCSGFLNCSVLNKNLVWAYPLPQDTVLNFQKFENNLLLYLRLSFFVCFYVPELTFFGGIIFF